MGRLKGATAGRPIYTNVLKSWIEATPKIKEWIASLREKNRSPDGIEVYASQFYRYAKDFILPTYGDLENYVAQKKADKKSDNVQTVRKWATELLGYLNTTRLMESSRYVLIGAVRSFLKEFVEPQPYRFEKLVTSEQKGKELEDDNDDDEEGNGITGIELHRLVSESDTRDKAAILTQISGGLAIRELLYFAERWKKYETQIRKLQVPIRINLYRQKTRVKYYSFLWDDAVDALHDLLKLRESQNGGKSPELLFVNKAGRAMDDHDLQVSVRYLADKTGLEPTRKGTPEVGLKPLYKFRPHCFRHFYKSECRNSNVSEIVSKFTSGRKSKRNIEDRYSEAEESTEGRKRMEKELQKVRPRLNILTHRGEIVKDNYWAELVKNSELLGKTPEELQRTVLYYVKRLAEKDFEKIKEELAKEATEGADLQHLGLPHITDEAALERLPKAILQPVVVAMVKDQNKPTGKVTQKVVLVDEIEKYLGEGWFVRSPINHEKVLVEREET